MQKSNPTAGARQVYSIVVDGATGINEELRMKNEESEVWYDLQGNRISMPTRKGLYIKNGKKTVVR